MAALPPPSRPARCPPLSWPQVSPSTPGAGHRDSQLPPQACLRPWRCLRVSLRCGCRRSGRGRGARWQEQVAAVGKLGRRPVSEGAGWAGPLTCWPVASPRILNHTTAALTTSSGPGSRPFRPPSAHRRPRRMRHWRPCRRRLQQRPRRLPAARCLLCGLPSGCLWQPARLRHATWHVCAWPAPRPSLLPSGAVVFKGGCESIGEFVGRGAWEAPLALCSGSCHLPGSCN